MQTANNDLSIFNQGWIFRIRPPVSSPAQCVVILIHGWTGDEFSMDVFSRKLPENYLLLFPRGPVRASPSGYGWVESQAGNFPKLEEFNPACDQLISQIDHFLATYQATAQPIFLVGFSQGAAMCHALNIFFPEHFERTAILAGFLPTPTDARLWNRVKNKSYFVAHGSLDETIPLQVIHTGIAKLRQAGARVTYCEKPVGHKLAGECFDQLNEFLR